MLENMNRRDFLKTTAATAALAVAPGMLSAQVGAPAGNAAMLPKRPYKPGVDVSIIGFAGLLLLHIKNDQDRCNRIVAEAYEKGCNYYDVAPAYGDSQQKLGPALEPYRKNVFLACKTKARDAAGAKKEFEESLKLLRTDHFDLYQMHVLKDPEKDVDAAFMKGGVMEFIEEKKKSGQIRYVGFSTHTSEAGIAAMERYPFDSIMFPLNYASFNKGEFGPAMLEKAKEKGVARIAIKGLCRQEWPQGSNRGKWRHVWYQPIDDPKEADLCLRWTLSQGITAAIPPADAELFRLAMQVGMNYRPTTPEEQQQVVALAQQMTPLFRKGKITG